MSFLQLQVQVAPGVSNSSLPALREMNLQEGEAAWKLTCACLDRDCGLRMEQMFLLDHPRTHLAFLTIHICLLLHHGDIARATATSQDW